MARNMNVVVCLLSLSMVASFPSEDVVILKRAEFHSSITDNNHFVLFCRPGHSQCTQLTPVWDELDHQYLSDDSAVTIGQVNCGVEKVLCEELRVTDVPVLRFYYRNSTHFKIFRGHRNFESLHRFVEEEVHHADNVTVADLPDAVVELDMDNFKEFVSERLHFVKFYTPWCAHCKLLAATWHELSLAIGAVGHVFISQVDCSKAQDLCAEYNIKAFPSLVLFFNGTMVEKYRGQQVIEDLKHYIDNKTAQYMPDPEGHPEVQYEKRVAVLTEESFDHVIMKHLVFVNFYTPWCEQCKKLKPEWEGLAETNKDREILLASVDCEEHSHLCDTHSVIVYPTLILYEQGIHLLDYSDNLTVPELQHFIDKFTVLLHDEL